MAGSETPDPRREPLGTWRPVDVLIVGYALFAALPLAYGALSGAPGCAAALAGNAVIALVAAVVVRTTRGRTGTWWGVLRLAYVPLSFIHLYREIGVIWPAFWAEPFDQRLADADFALFRTQPSLAFQAAFPARGLGELFCFAYYAYYYFNPLVLVTVLVKRGYARAERVLFAVAFCFFCCYTFFWLFPTVGPHFFLTGRGPQPYPGYVFNHLLWLYTGSGEIAGGAFPSSHIAVAVLYTLLARKEAPRLFPFLAVITLLMMPGVVYLRAHYAVDVPTGLALGLAFAWIGPKVHDLWNRRAEATGAHARPDATAAFPEPRP